MRRGAVAIAVLIVLALVPMGPAVAAGGGPLEPEWFVDESRLPFDPLPGFEDADLLWGVHRGAGYRIEVPGDWNGSLVMWAHGYRGEGLELTVDNHPLRPHLLANGFAWAASSYSSNSYNAGDGVADTYRLVRLFQELSGEPDTTYITGASMGGHVTARSIEQYPEAYDGALPICGVVGDYELFDYFLDYNVAAQQLGLGDSQVPVDDPEAYIATDVPAIKASLEAEPGGWPTALNADGVAFKQLVELRSGGDRPNFDEAWAFWNSINSAAGPGNFLFDLGTGDGTVAGRRGVVWDNHDVEYQLDLDPAISEQEAAFNTAIERVLADRQPRGSRALNPIPVVTGRIGVPVLSLHNLGDLFVPFHNEIAYAGDVARQGRGDLLVQRAIRGVGHCEFTPTEMTMAFDDLVGWVQGGIRPDGDVVLAPEVVASGDYGCRFTDFSTPNGHRFATPCD
jgi:dienelactone hydrolase